MSDAALIGQSGNPPKKVKSESLDHSAGTGNIVQSQPATTNSAGGGSHVTTSGSVVQSSDPTTRPDASVAEKLKGDVQGAIKGSIGSVQAATGTMMRNKEMEAKGLDKMQEEDQRLGAKRGVMPVGTDRRNETVDASAAGEEVPK